MSYESPIFVYEDVCREISEGAENAIMASITKIGVKVDKRELLRALEYDRDQYEAGARDMRGAMIEEGYRKVVFCKDCIYGEVFNGKRDCECIEAFDVPDEGFCFYGERKEDDDGQASRI